MRFKGLVLFSVSAILSAVGCSATPADENVVRGAQAVQGGQLDTTSTFAVGLCLGAAGSCHGSCSGTLILPNLVVTARHCVDKSPQVVDCSRNLEFGGQMLPLGQYFVTTNAATTQGRGVGAGWYGVSRILRPTVDGVCGNDIALLVLDGMVPSSEATPAIPGVQYDMGDPRYDNRYTAIGYGITSPDGNDSGKRRILQQNRLTCIPGDKYIPCPPDLVNPKEFIGDDGVCSGDSGSGAFEQDSFDAGKPVSWGVASRAGSSEDGTQCLTSIYTRLDAWRDLVVSAAETASNNWQLYPKPVPDWTVFVPKPDPDAGADAGPPAPKAALGDACVTADNCASGVCIDAPDGSGDGVCSQDCTEGAADACPEAFFCSGGLCLEGTQTTAAPAKKTVEKSACSAGAIGRTDTGAGAFALAFALAAVVAGRRRRS